MAEYIFVVTFDTSCSSPGYRSTVSNSSSKLRAAINMSALYLPKQFQVTDKIKILEFIRQFPLGMMVCVSQEGEPIINHLPFVCVKGADSGERMLAHVARANTIWRSFPDKNGIPATVVFSGPSAYISPSWYAEKQTTHKVVPTYAYSTVHVKGTLRFTDDEAEKLSIVSVLTSQFESLRTNPWKVSDAPADFIKAHLRGIVGCHFDIISVTAKWKANQNHTAVNRNNVTEGLTSDAALGVNGGCALSALMADEFRYTGCPLAVECNTDINTDTATDTTTTARSSSTGSSNGDMEKKG